jgi:hypothetical protein
VNLASSASYHPRLLPGLLIDGYATGVFSSRKPERAGHDGLAFRFVAANRHSDHDRIAAFRRRFLRGIGGLFVGVLLLARGMTSPPEKPTLHMPGARRQGISTAFATGPCRPR